MNDETVSRAAEVDGWGLIDETESRAAEADGWGLSYIVGWCAVEVDGWGLAGGSSLPAEVDGWGLAGGVAERALDIKSWLGLAGGDGDVDVFWCCVFDGELGECVTIDSGQFKTPSVNFSRALLMPERGDKRFEDKTETDDKNTKKHIDFTNTLFYNFSKFLILMKIFNYYSQWKKKDYTLRVEVKRIQM